MSLSTLSLCILYICYRGAGDQQLVRLEQEQVVPPEFRTTDGDIAALQIQQGTLQVCSYFFQGWGYDMFFYGSDPDPAQLKKIPDPTQDST